MVLFGVVYDLVIFVDYHLLKVCFYFQHLSNSGGIKSFGNGLIFDKHFKIIEILNRIGLKPGHKRRHGINPSLILKNLLRILPFPKTLRPSIQIHQILIPKLTPPQIITQPIQIPLPKRRLLKDNFITIIIIPNDNAIMSEMLRMQTNYLVTDGVVGWTLGKVQETLARLL